MPEVAPSIIIPADMPIYPTSGFYSDTVAPSRFAPPLLDALLLLLRMLLQLRIASLRN